MKLVPQRIILGCSACVVSLYLGWIELPAAMGGQHIFIWPAFVIPIVSLLWAFNVFLPPPEKRSDYMNTPEMQARRKKRAAMEKIWAEEDREKERAKLEAENSDK